MVGCCWLAFGGRKERACGAGELRRRSARSGLPINKSLRAAPRSRGARSRAFSSNRFLTEATTLPLVGERGGGGGGGSLLGVLIQDESCCFCTKLRTYPVGGLPKVARGARRLEGGGVGGGEVEPMACIRLAALLGV